MGPLVSIVCFTYNQEKFISQTIEGFLIQKTSFTYEVLIHDDASTDRTQEIIKAYQQKHPDIIKPIFQTTNQYSLGKRIVPLVLPHCRGKYIALCEGDDYWTDSKKLQKQVEFLEENRDYSICFHPIYKLENEKGLQLNKISSNKETFTIEDLAREGNFIGTPSVIFRNNMLENFQDWFNNMPISDYPLHFYNAQYGKIKYLPDAMAVYRIHSNGAWSLTTKRYQYEKLILVIDNLIVLFSGNHAVINNLNFQKSGYWAKLAEIEYEEDSQDLYIEYLEKAFQNSEEFRKTWLLESKASAERLNTRVNNLYQSKSYLLGNSLIKPLGWVNSLINKRRKK